MEERQAVLCPWWLLLAQNKPPNAKRSIFKLWSWFKALTASCQLKRCHCLSLLWSLLSETISTDALVPEQAPGHSSTNQATHKQVDAHSSDLFLIHKKTIPICQMAKLAWRQQQLLPPAHSSCCFSNRMEAQPRACSLNPSNYFLRSQNELVGSKPFCSVRSTEEWNLPLHPWEKVWCWGPKRCSMIKRFIFSPLIHLYLWSWSRAISQEMRNICLLTSVLTVMTW